MVARNTKVLLTITVFLTSLITYLIACPEWFFDGEDWGLIFKGAQCSGLKDFLDYFLHGKVNLLAREIITDNPIVLAKIAPHDTFFTVYYRPMLLALHAIQYYFFNIHAYSYFIFIITMHASIAALLFYLLTSLVQPAIALLCSFFFAFHPILYSWFGRIDTQQHLVNVLLMLALFIILKKSLERHSLALYILACLLFLISLLTRETLIVFPAILFLWSFPLSYYAPFGYLKKLSSKLILFSGFCIVIHFYFFMKSITYPIVISIPAHVPVLFSITKFITAWSLFLYDFFWLQWFPWTTYEFFRKGNLLLAYKFIKITIVLCVGALFITNTKKRLILLLILTAFIVYWPPILFASKGGLRLFYESLPFVMFALAYLLNYSILLSNRLARYVIYALFSLLIGINGYAVINGMHQMMIMPKKIDFALKNLKQSSPRATAHNPLVILSTHGPFYSCGIIQAFELHGINTIRPRYFFDAITVHSHGNFENINRLVRIKKYENSIALVSERPENLWFQSADDPEHQGSPGIHMKINQITPDSHITNLSLDFDKDFYHPDLIVVVWLFEEEKFVSLM